MSHYFRQASDIENQVLSLDNPVYEVPADERPASPTYVEPDQLNNLDHNPQEMEYLEVIV